MSRSFAVASKTGEIMIPERRDRKVNDNIRIEVAHLTDCPVSKNFLGHSSHLGVP